MTRPLFLVEHVANEPSSPAKPASSARFRQSPREKEQLNTIQRLAEPELRVIHELVMEIDEAPTLAASLHLVLDKVCAVAAWMEGVAWQVEGDVIEHGPNSLEEIGPLLTRSRGERALIVEPTSVAVPVLAGGQVVAVFGFATTDDPARMRWISVLTVVAAHLGGWFRRRKAEEARTTSDARFRHLVENVGDAVLMLDPAGLIVLWPPAAERLFGYTTSEAVGRPVAMLLLSEPSIDGAESPLSALDVATSDGRAESDEWRVAKDGSRLWTHVVTSPMYNVAGVLDGFAQIVRDLTPMKVAADALKQRSLALERSNTSLAAFASIASHDLQEPLRKIRSFGDRLTRRCAAVLDEEGRSHLERMVAAAVRMQDLIDDLLTFSRVTAQEQVYQAVDLNEIARQVKADLESSIEKSGGRVDISELPTVDADPSQMRQVLQNLIGNALKFRRKDVAPVVTVSGSRILEDGLERCRFNVTDNGIGFDEKYLGRIFEMLQRLHTRADYEGTGMGLAIVRGIVERHSGSITAKSAPNVGATFTVTLPLRQRQHQGAS